MSGLIDQAKNDWQRFSSDPNAFGIPITFTAPAPGSEVSVINGLGTNHHVTIDTDGNTVNSKNSHVSVSEQLLVDDGYPTRAGGDEINMVGHRVSFEDSTGVTKEYQIDETLPDETVGMIICFLTDFE